MSLLAKCLIDRVKTAIELSFIHVLKKREFWWEAVMEKKLMWLNTLPLLTSTL